MPAATCELPTQHLWRSQSRSGPDDALPAPAATPDASATIDIGALLPTWQLPDPHTHWRTQGRLLDAWLIASLVLLMVQMVCEMRLRFVWAAAILGIAGALGGRLELPGAWASVRRCRERAWLRAARSTQTVAALARGAGLALVS